VKRRVIFPDPSIWTNKEHTMTDDSLTNAGDYRRAAALTLHHRQGNTAGVLAIIDETNNTGRGPQLLFATLDLHEQFISVLRTRDGINLMADYVHGMAALDADAAPGTEIVRAARILEFHGLKEPAGITREMQAVGGDAEATQIFIALLDLYEVAMPELSSQVGIRWIQDHIAAMATEEVQE